MNRGFIPQLLIAFAKHFWCYNIFNVTLPIALPLRERAVIVAQPQRSVIWIK